LRDLPGDLLPVDDQPQTPREWEAWLATTRKTLDVIGEDGTSDKAKPRLVHAHCGHRSGPALLPARQPSGLA
jgi:hypothetical protein